MSLTGTIHETKLTGTISTGNGLTAAVDENNKVQGFVSNGGTVQVPGPQGLSAYEVWLEEGNTGTEEDFFAALKGDAITVKSIQQSPDDGGENIVTFSDDSQLSVWNGKKGTDGKSVGILQTSLSEEDGGTNVVVFSDLRQTRLYIKNGSKGSDGKTAYEYAADAGYTGTEEEFAEKLAADNVTDVADEVTSGNMLPVTSNAVAQTVGNIEILLSTI